MTLPYDILAMLGKLSFMLIVLGVAVVLSQAVWVAFIVQGTKLVRQRQPFTFRDVVTGLGEDGVWLAYLGKRPVACFGALLAGAGLFQAGVHHPGWVGLAVVLTFTGCAWLTPPVRRGLGALALVLRLGSFRTRTLT